MPTNGKTIIKDAIAVCNYLTDYGVDRNNDIASTHSYVFDEKTPWNVIREVADACSTSDGAVGFDGYVDPAGNLWIFKRGSQTSTVDLTDKIIRYKVDYDTYRVKNKIKVYGAIGKTLPADQDSWTENSAASWTAVYGGVVDSTDVYPGKKGGKTLRFYSTSSSPYKMEAYYNLPSTLFMSKDYSKLIFWMYNNFVDVLTKLEVRLYTSTSDYFSKEIEFQAEWTYFELPCGTQNDKEWTATGNAKWSNINKIGFYAEGTAGFTFYIDNLFFTEIRYSGSAEDTTSQGLYGVRMPEPTVDDSLQSDDDCTKKAQSLLAYYKDKVTTITLTTFGNNAFKPGDMLYINLPNDNINGSFRILEITHSLQDVFWQTELLLSNEPIMIDYIFRKMFEVQKTLAGNK